MRPMRFFGLGVAAAIAVAVLVVIRPAPALPFQGKPAPTKEQRACAACMAGSVNEFGFKLAARVAKSRPNDNLLISPLSVATAHSMLLMGTGGETKKELACALGFAGTTDSAVNAGMYALNYDTQCAQGCRLRAANGFVLLGNHPVGRRFESVLKVSYDAEVKTLPGATQGAADEVNGWVNTRTDGMIPSLVDGFPEGATFALLNASAFVGEWNQVFSASKTSAYDFTTASGRVVQVPMMHLNDHAFRAAPGTEQPTIIELPYKGKAFGMILMLAPGKESATQLLAGMTAAKWAAATSKMRPEDVDVALPKFAFDDSVDLRGPITSLGAHSLFRAGADLSGVSPDASRNWIGVDVHRTHIDVDENGTRAGAATDVEDALAENPIFLADRPFIFAVVHKPTGVIVFLGACNDPTQRR